MVRMMTYDQSYPAFNDLSKNQFAQCLICVYYRYQGKVNKIALLQELDKIERRFFNYLIKINDRSGSNMKIFHHKTI